MLKLGKLDRCVFICAQSALDKHLHKCLAAVLTAKCKRQRRTVGAGVGAFLFFSLSYLDML